MTRSRTVLLARLLAAACLAATGCTSSDDAKTTQETGTSAVTEPSETTSSDAATTPDSEPVTTSTPTPGLALTDSMVSPDGTVTMQVPAEWTARRSFENDGGGIVIEATTSEVEFALDGIPGIRVSTLQATDFSDRDPADVGIFFGPATRCESDLVEVDYESTELPGTRYDYTDCGPSGDLNASFVVLDATDLFSVGIVLVFAGPGDPTVEELIAGIEVTPGDAPALQQVTDDSGRLSVTVPGDWDVDTRPGEAGNSFIGAAEPDAVLTDDQNFVDGNLQYFLAGPIPDEAIVDSHSALLDIFGIVTACGDVQPPTPFTQNGIASGLVTRASGCGEGGSDVVAMLGVDANRTESYVLVVATPAGADWTGEDALSSVAVS